MAMKGFDPELVRNSIGGVQTGFDNLIRAIGTDMQSQFVGGMQDKWACNEAIKFFTTVKTSVDEIITSSNKTFESVVNAMNDAAKGWADRTESSWGGISFSGNNTKIDVSGIVENLGGVRGIDDTEAMAVANKLPTIAQRAENALTSAQNAVRNSGFIGGSQETELVNSLGKIKTQLNSVITQMSEECKKAIQITSENYAKLEIQVSDAFSIK